MDFKITSKFKPAGDQPKAIDSLISGVEKGFSKQTLLGVTGSGKTFTIANVVERLNKPTLVIAHNKTLAAQLCNEFRELFPDNAVHYFVSYYDYYQPEAYIPSSDTYIGKEAMINEEIDKLRHAATTSLLTRRDVLIVASVSCIYGLGAPETYRENILYLRTGNEFVRNDMMKKLISLQFSRTTADLKRGTFRVRGDNWDIMPPNEEVIYSFRAEDGLIGDIFAIDPVKGFEPGKTPAISEVVISPAKHFITAETERKKAIKIIEKELKERLKFFEKENKFLEAERLERRTRADIAMLKEIGYCNGIENYSRHLSGRNSGEAPSTLLDYFPDSSAGGFLTVIDESHVTVPQIRGMYEGDASRKKTLIEHGFRLPSAADNRPLRYKEFEEKVHNVIYTSATPADYEIKESKQVVEQIIRPTGLVDPRVTILSAKGQVSDLIGKLKEKAGKKERCLVTTLTKKMAEDLSEYLEGEGVKVRYLHSDVKTMDRIKILTGLRKGDFDVLVGVNLLREGLDLPEVTLVAILDADKEGFLRSETSLIQTIGRAARNVDGEVILYADNITGSVKRAFEETERRRKLQIAYNKKHGITPKTIIRDIKSIIPDGDETLEIELGPIKRSKSELEKLLKTKIKEMKKAADNLEFELASVLRDEIKTLEEKMGKNKEDTIKGRSMRKGIKNRK
ncbi:MAG: excinuclease ABC subunit UvrB [Candidatus Colwellbacteria bacterium]|jgi:excinuclease ABC subunit B|nr:excinuclease ABC subunit UvrB [Candidatus Colwellbacteria bacterium]MDD3752422.1 excinuclease ABC subunit UvrB [Candidatus Colwellbacteria bacterium]